MKKSVSLQSKLVRNAMLSSILAGLFAWLMLIAVSGYQVMQIQDELMQEIGDVLLGDVNQGRGVHVDEISEEFGIQYQLNLDDWMLTQSEDHHLLQNQNYTSGFHLIYENGQWIRVLTIADNELSTQIVQPLWVRFNEIWQSVLMFGVVLAILWLLQWLILSFVVKRQLRPLNKISKAIASKSAQDLTPIRSPQPDLQELQPIVQQLNAMLTRLDHALMAEQRFTADASHELRSPLSAIQMRLQVLKRKYQNHPKLPQALQQIQNDVNRGTQVLENLLLLARLDPEQAQGLLKQNVLLSNVMNDVIQALQPFADEKNIQYEVHIQDSEIHVNAELMFSCIRNLVDNAIRYSPKHETIFIRTESKSDSVQLIIENAGQGISDDVITHLGERFYRVLGTRTQGSGLGLSICQKIMQLHQGKITFEASSLGGLKVILDIPKAI